jgi:hypothetical protein
VAGCSRVQTLTRGVQKQSARACSPTPSCTLANMVAVQADKNEIRVSIPTEGLSPESLTALPNWLRVEVAARRSRLTEAAAWQLAEEIKADWWVRNEARFPESKS